MYFYDDQAREYPKLYFYLNSFKIIEQAINSVTVSTENGERHLIFNHEK